MATARIYQTNLTRWDLKVVFGPHDHRLFREEATGRWAVADNSGTLPEDTEDGILWIDGSRTISIVNGSYLLPLTQDHTCKQTQTLTSRRVAAFVSGLLDMRITLTL